MKTTAVAFGITLIILLSGCANMKLSNVLNWVLPIGHYEIQSNVSYGAESRQTLDIYSPKSSDTITASNNKPVIVFVYGGAWKTGDKQDYLFIAEAFTRAGYQVVIPDYRLYPTVKFPLFINDIADAIAFIEQFESPLLDVSQGIILMGHSAGAHTAALLATDQHYFNLEKSVGRRKDA